jgi:Fic family protein
MNTLTGNYDLSDAVSYHYNKFPHVDLKLEMLIQPLASASAALARYDQMLAGMHNSELLLAPLRRQEAVVSSRIEGTVSTLDEVLHYEADQDEDGKGAKSSHHRTEAIEVYLYHKAMQQAQTAMQDGAPISDWLVRSAHATLLGFGRGANMPPGKYKDEQNYLVDRTRKQVLFIPINPEHLPHGMEKLFAFMEDEEIEAFIRTAIAHVEFEALHPFKDGNGRIGRMLITLMLWRLGKISAPHLYISGYLEQRREEYIERMRQVSRDGAWTEWVVFFLGAIESQAQYNLRIAEAIAELYGQMKDDFRIILSSKWSTVAVDFVFGQPVFWSNQFTSKSGIPRPTAAKIPRALVEGGLLRVVRPAAGRRPALYAFEPLLEIVRG